MQGPNAGQTVPGMQDPINALQNLASQGTRNTQLMGHGIHPAGNMPPIPASNLLQTLNQRPGPGLQGLQGLQGKINFLIFNPYRYFLISIRTTGGPIRGSNARSTGIKPTWRSSRAESTYRATTKSDAESNGKSNADTGKIL